MEITSCDFSLLQERLKTGKITVTQTVQQFLENTLRYRHLNAFLEVFDKEALARASAIDEKIARNEAGRLAGMVIAIKDNICYKDHRVSAASKILENFTSIYYATAVERLLAEDAIIIGRLNCDEFGMGSTNENSAFGAVRNFLDETRVAGGSSGGSAVAVQAGLCHAALGSDTGGSLRTPASYCGVIGMKPTYGRISRHGLIAYASSFDQIGTITNNIEDAALLLEIMSGKDNYDSTASQQPVSQFSKNLTSDKKFSIAYFTQTLDHPQLDDEIKNTLRSTISALKNNGHTIEAAELPLLDYLVPAYYILTTAEASSNLARYDGVRYGFRHPESSDMEALYRNSRSAAFGAEVKRRIMLGTFVLSAGYQDAYYTRAQKVRRMIKNATDEIFKKFDFILLPTTPSVAPKLGEKTNPVEVYLSDIFTVHANLAGIPAISLPLGKNSNGMPFGIQLMTDHFQEQQLLQLSAEMMNSAE